MVLMSAEPMEDLSAIVEMNGSGTWNVAGRLERRKRVRMQLHWPVCFSGIHAAGTIETKTRDLSSDGFYCLSKTPLVPGTLISCTLKVPAHDPFGDERMLPLECKIRVIRVEPKDEDGNFGIGCHIEDYHFATR